MAGIVEKPNGPTAVSSALDGRRLARLLELMQGIYLLIDEIPEAVNSTKHSGFITKDRTQLGRKGANAFTQDLETEEEGSGRFCEGGMSNCVGLAGVRLVNDPGRAVQMR